MSDQSSIIPYRPPGKPRAVIESGQAVMNFSIRPPSVWKGAVAWCFAAAMFLLMVIRLIGPFRIDLSGLILAALLGALLFVILRLIVRRRRVPTLISVGDGFLIILTPDFFKMHHEFEIGARLRIRCKSIASAFSYQPGQLEVMDSDRVVLIFAHGGNVTELKKIEREVNQAIWNRLVPRESSVHDDG
jgi:hypothetical protein